MARFRYPSNTLHEFVTIPKRVVGDKLEFHEVRERSAALREDDPDRKKSASKEARVVLEAKGGRAALLELVIKAGRLNDVTTYSASLLVDQVRIRGVDFSRIERSLYFKKIIPKGWHQNIIDPNTDENRHEPLDIGTVTDLDDFSDKVIKLWNINYKREGKLL